MTSLRTVVFGAPGQRELPEVPTISLICYRTRGPLHAAAERTMATLLGEDRSEVVDEVGRHDAALRVPIQWHWTRPAGIRLVKWTMVSFASIESSRDKFESRNCRIERFLGGRFHQALN
jgi:hypothetical protein